MTTNNQNDPEDIAFIDFEDALESSSASEEHSDDMVDNKPEVNYLPLDFASALDELNQERDALFGKKNTENENASQAPIEFSVDLAKNCIKKNGITFFLNTVKTALDEAGYTQFGDTQFMHPKSGVLTRF